MPASRIAKSPAPSRRRPVTEKKPVRQPAARQGGQGVAQMQQQFGNRGTQALLREQNLAGKADVNKTLFPALREPKRQNDSVVPQSGEINAQQPEAQVETDTDLVASQTEKGSEKANGSTPPIEAPSPLTGEQPAPAVKAEKQKKQGKENDNGNNQKDQEDAQAETALSPMEAIAPATKSLQKQARRASAHAPALTLSDSAQSAAKEPAVEQQRGAATQSVGGLDEAASTTGEVDRNSFRDSLKKALAESVPEPRSPEHAEQLMEEGASNSSVMLSGAALGQAQQAAGGLDSSSQTESDVLPGSVEVEPAAEIVQETPVSLEAVSPTSVVPTPLPAKQLDYSADRSGTDQLMAENNVNKSQLEKGGSDPQFGAALQARSEAEQNEATAANRYRESESGIHASANEQAAQSLEQGIQGLQGVRANRVNQVSGQQENTRQGNAAERTRITAQITQIKDQTRQSVEKILAEMKGEAETKFADGLKKAEELYEKVFDDALGGVGTRLGDFFTGKDRDERIEESFDKARSAYNKEVSSAIDKVADYVESMLQKARDKVAEGKQQVDEFVASLDESVRGFGEKARESIGSEFEAMGSEIDQQRDGLIDSLAQQYADSRQRMQQREQELREENKSFWQKVYDATVGVVQKILEFKNLLLSILSSAADVVEAIIQDPIGFLGNLIKGVKSGLDLFVGKIGEHLKQGLLGWLFGAMQNAGIQMPQTFDMKGIFSLISQVLGLTWDYIRSRAVKIVGEPIVSKLEQAAEIFIIIKNEGLAGLWEMLKEKVIQLKDTVMEEINSWLITKVIKAGVQWIIGLLNPAAALIKAVKAIYDIIMFFVERGQQLIELVQAVIGSLSAIVGGKLSAMAEAVEGALAKALPVAIGLLASLLGLGGISSKIKEIIQKIRKPVTKVVDWVIGKAVKFARKMGKLFSKKKDRKKEPEYDDPEKQAKIQAGKSYIEKASQEKIVNGGLTEDTANSVLKEAKSKHKVFKTLSLVESDGSWKYKYTASAGDTVDFAKQSGDIELEIHKYQAKKKVAKLDHRLFEGGVKKEINSIHTQLYGKKNIVKKHEKARLGVRGLPDNLKKAEKENVSIALNEPRITLLGETPSKGRYRDTSTSKPDYVFIEKNEIYIYEITLRKVWAEEEGDSRKTREMKLHKRAQLANALVRLKDIVSKTKINLSINIIFISIGEPGTLARKEIEEAVKIFPEKVKSVKWVVI